VEILTIHYQPSEKGRAAGFSAATAMTKFEWTSGPCDFEPHPATKTTPANHAVYLSVEVLG
jgi:hypothetical protein